MNEAATIPAGPERPLSWASAGPRRAMILAAGLGTRMQPLTDTRPKPLIEVRGRGLLDRILDRLLEAGVSDVVVNVHCLADQVMAALARRRARGEGPETEVSHEKTLLETGGGVAKALGRLGAKPFFVINGDVLWLDGVVPALARLSGAWDGAAMDALLLVHRTAGIRGYRGLGDFLLATDGRMRRRREREVTPHMFTGIQILHPRLFDGQPVERFSLNRSYDRAQEAGRLWGVLHDGMLFHVGTPEELREAETLLALGHQLPVSRQDKK